MSGRERVLIVDDHPIFRHGLRTILEHQDWVEAIVEADTAAAAVKAAVEHRVTVVAMDVALPDADGIEATRRILQLRPEVNILMLTMLDDDELVVRALQAGARSFARKDISPNRLIQALAAVADGGVVLGAAVGAVVIANLQRTPVVLPPPFDRLNERERQILAQLAGGGANNGQIARKIGLSEKTVRNHVSAIYTKLGVADRIRAALLVRDSGVLPYLTANPPTQGD
jgi:two-component system, NarL family, nitrate/nitrite response regulator NarL